MSAKIDKITWARAEFTLRPENLRWLQEQSDAREVSMSKILNELISQKKK